jgi:hypothetical protein
MRRTEAIAWVVSVCAVSLRLSQAKTLAALVASATRVERVSLANLGRRMLGNAKHQIKRCWRFCNNGRVAPADAMRGVVGRLVRKRKKPLLVALDWVDVRGTCGGSRRWWRRRYSRGGRCRCAGPVARATRTTGSGAATPSRSRCSWSSARWSRRGWAGVKVILLADRGFGRAALAAFCRRQGFSYLIRIQPKVTVKLKGFCGKLLDYPIRKGIAKVLKDVAYRADGAVSQHVVVRWRTDLPPKRDECWFLMTDLKGTAHQLCALYARRMTIEQLFRDHKSKRNGWSLRDTQLKTPQRLDRLLLVLALAYLLLCGLGLIAQKTHKPSAWCSSSKELCSIFVIGLLMRDKLKVSPAQAFAAVLELNETLATKWG